MTAFPFQPIIRGGPLWPCATVMLEGMPTPLRCLVDSGSRQNRFAAWTAKASGIDLASITPTRIGIGGEVLSARTTPVRLSIGGFSWEAPVSFCDPWPWDHNLVGHEGFFRFFVVTIDAANHVLDIKPNAT